RSAPWCRRSPRTERTLLARRPRISRFGGVLLGRPDGVAYSGVLMETRRDSTPFPYRDLDACLLFASPDLRPQPFAYEFESVRFPGVKCGRCDFVFLRRQPVGEGFARMYDAKYFESDYHCGHEERPYFAAEREESGA